MSYESARRFSIRDAHHWRIDDFATRYRNGRPTIVLLPGGMGSQLDRSQRRYINDSSVPFEDYGPAWMDLGILFGNDAQELEIRADGRDIGDHVIVPDGPLRFLTTPYEGTQEYFNQQGFNYIVFGYDWRRSIVESAGYLRFFLETLKARVLALRGEDPLPQTTLLCHSMGGLITLLFFQQLASRGEAIGEWLARVVTVGTPFYGTATHMDRYYQGQSPLNGIYGTAEIARLAGTFPGPYMLLYLDRATYHADGTAIGLERYPLRDATEPNKPADPHAAAQRGRFPPWVAGNYLDKARRLRRTLIQPLPDEYVARMFNLRAWREETAVELHWEPVHGDLYNPDSDDNPLLWVSGEGDGTVPYWSARFAQVPMAQVFRLRVASKHGDLLEHEETLRVVERLIAEDRLPNWVLVDDERRGQPKASGDEVDAFVEGVASSAIRREDVLATDVAIWRSLMEEISLC